MMDIKDTLKRPAVMWTALALILIIGALMVPIEWVRSVGDFLGEEEQATDVFSDSVAGVDKALAAGASVEMSDARLAEMRPHLQVRRLATTGPMTHEDVVEATEMMRDFNAQIASQELEGSKEALRNERNRRLAEAFPRLDAAKIGPTLAELNSQLETAKD
ncbi:hypothetical protein FIV42_07885 [Persicimonas caeni]|uniref:Uncharacterized protein n=1 Tax=Persicimonas caeni TaxID=2292766 RepID=A0A4Y6PQQ2_PERCE|nr:hypothetical protein [Persicimonas caeni]QDG50654.1 hypothetical protein FIV42_07885 [Persicimonas caeni]QED31875.1 hypothetical protein FRD00_07880 [Persicimonas caeni]